MHVKNLQSFHAQRVELLVTRLGCEQQQHQACISIPSCGDGTSQVLGGPSFSLLGDALVCRAGAFLPPFSCQVTLHTRNMGSPVACAMLLLFILTALLH